MAQRKSSSAKAGTKKSPTSKKSSKKQVEVVTLHPETRKWVYGISLFVVAAVALLALFNLAGIGGQYVLQFMQLLFGSLAFLFPLIVIAIGYIIINHEKLELTAIHYIGALLTVLSLTAFFNLFIPVASVADELSKGVGGGYVGLALSYVLMNMVGFWASLLVITALFVIGVLLMVNQSLEDFAESGNVVGRMLSALQSRWYDLRYGELDERDNEAEEEDEEEDIEEEDEEAVEAPGFVAKPITMQSEAQAVSAAPVKRTAQVASKKPVEKIVYKKVDIPLDLLENSSGTASSGNPIRTKEKIQKTFESFNIQVDMGPVHVGPTVTQYELFPAEGIKLSRITALQDDLALALAAHPLRIEAPIPGKSAVGVEIPNTSVEMVRLKELLMSKEFKSRKGDLEIPLGKDVTGRTWNTPLDKMPHLLVAGATGSGKSVCLNTIITSLLYQNSPETLRFIMVDPKKVELSAYEGIPHLLTPVVTDVKKTVNALKWAVAEMERRYTLLQHATKRNIESYNKASSDKLPYIVFVIDEMADLMVSARNEVESLIIRLAQMSRAVGIHLVLATQRPSVDVITGLIKANVPTRIAFAVASSMDSRTILDSTGAEKLIGKGDMLFSNPQYKKPVRIQGAFLSEDEVSRVVEYIRERSSEPQYMEGITEKASGSGEVDFSDPHDGDELFDEAKRMVVDTGKASTSFLQRRFKIGYSRAARIMDLLEEAGVVGPQDGAKPREILVTERELEDDFSEGFDVVDDELQTDYEDEALDEEAYEQPVDDEAEEVAEEEEDDDVDEGELDEALEVADELEEEAVEDEDVADDDEDDWVNSK